MRIDSRCWTATCWRWRRGAAEFNCIELRETKKGNDENGTERFRRSADNLVFAQNLISPSRKVAASAEEGFAYVVKWCKSRLSRESWIGEEGNQFG
jgi:hypothetical protein